MGLLSGSDSPWPTASSSEYSEVESLSSIFGDNIKSARQQHNVSDFYSHLCLLCVRATSGDKK